MLAAGCGGDDAFDVGSGSGGLRGRTFLSESVSEDGSPRDLVGGTRIQLTFHEGRLMAYAGCNSLGGPVDVEGDRLFVGGLTTTEIGCAPELHDQDEWLAGILAAGPAFQIEGDRLVLRRGSAEITLIDREVAAPDRPLEGTTWELDGIVDGDAVSSVPAGASATLTFVDGMVGFQVEGCNQGSADVEIGPGEFQVGPLTTTLIGCREPAATVETAIRATLQGSVAYSVEATTLTLSNPNGRGLLLRAGD